MIYDHNHNTIMKENYHNIDRMMILIMRSWFWICFAIWTETFSQAPQAQPFLLIYFKKNAKMVNVPCMKAEMRGTYVHEAKNTCLRAKNMYEGQHTWLRANIYNEGQYSWLRANIVGWGPTYKMRANIVDSGPTYKMRANILDWGPTYIMRANIIDWGPILLA